MYGVTIAELIEKMDFKNLTPELDSEKIVVSHPDVNRPALQLTGFYAHFDNERVQMIGNVEIAYLSGLSRDRRIAMYDKLISSKIPCLVFCRNQIPEPEVTELCSHYGVPCLLSSKPTSDTMAEVIAIIGFSVVEPMKRTTPFSSAGSSASLCVLLQRWHSSSSR